ncbi:MAG: hypothetical protein ABI352_05255 [Candidatus Dormibacter sp.]
MIREASVSVDRPEPGHYQHRLCAALNRLPALLPPPPPPVLRAAERHWRTSGRHRRSGQLPLPLEPR